jgi:hypothetical protein
MPFSLKVLEPWRIVVITPWGRISDQEHRETFHRELANRLSDGPIRVLWDSRLVAKAESTEHLRGMVELMRESAEKLAGARIAIMAERPTDYDMARLLDILTEELPFELSVFRDFKEAVDWLRSGDEPDAA